MITIEDISNILPSLTLDSDTGELEDLKEVLKEGIELIDAELRSRADWQCR
jgi:hypothetical protein